MHRVSTNGIPVLTRNQLSTACTRNDNWDNTLTYQPSCNGCFTQNTTSLIHYLAVYLCHFCNACLDMYVRQAVELYYNSSQCQEYNQQRQTNNNRQPNELLIIRFLKLRQAMTARGNYSTQWSLMTDLTHLSERYQLARNVCATNTLLCWQHWRQVDISQWGCWAACCTPLFMSIFSSAVRVIDISWPKWCRCVYVSLLVLNRVAQIVTTAHGLVILHAQTY